MKDNFGSLQHVNFWFIAFSNQFHLLIPPNILSGMIQKLKADLLIGRLCLTLSLLGIYACLLPKRCPTMLWYRKAWMYCFCWPVLQYIKFCCITAWRYDGKERKRGFILKILMFFTLPLFFTHINPGPSWPKP